MIKVRLTYTNDKEGIQEKEMMIKEIEKEFNVLSISKEYLGRGNSIYNNIYLDVKVK